MVLTPDASTPSLAVANGSAPRNFIVTFRGEGRIPADFAERVAALGGRVEMTSPSAGIAAVAGMSDAAAASLAKSNDILAVEEDFVVALNAPVVADRAELASFDGEIMANPDKAAAYGLQWTYKVIGAPTAWEKGIVGSATTRVAILDTGIDDTHRDLRGLVDKAASGSFVPADAAIAKEFFGEGVAPYMDLNGHGTHVASTVSSNAVFFAGVTQKTTLIAVKVLGANGSGSGNGILAGIVHAVDKKADVINMSLGGYFLRAGGGAPAALNRVTSYARRSGVTIVVAAGNEELDLDHIGRDYAGPGTGSLYAMWCDNPNVICVSATGPLAAPTAKTPAAEYDLFAIYSNYGQSAIKFAAPGGNLSFKKNEDGTLVLDKAGNPIVAGVSFVIQACSRFALDWVDPVTDAEGKETPGFFKKSVCAQFPNSVFTSGQIGTSQATPHVTGLAALLVERLGRSPSAIRDAIQASADDRGKEGSDPYYGKGRINVARALGL